MSRLIEQGQFTDVYADGVHHMEMLGENVRIVYFCWRVIDGNWAKVGIDIAQVRPVGSIPVPLIAFNVPIIRRSETKIIPRPTGASDRLIQ